MLKVQTTKIRTLNTEEKKRGHFSHINDFPHFLDLAAVSVVTEDDILQAADGVRSIRFDDHHDAVSIKPSSSVAKSKSKSKSSNYHQDGSSGSKRKHHGHHSSSSQVLFFFFKYVSDVVQLTKYRYQTIFRISLSDSF